MKKYLSTLLSCLLVLACIVSMTGCMSTGTRTPGPSDPATDDASNVSDGTNWDDFFNNSGEGNSTNTQGNNNLGTTTRKTQGGGNATTTTTEKRVVTTVPKVSASEFPWPNLKFNNNKLTILYPWQSDGGNVAKLLKEKYGITTEFIVADWFGINTKFQQMWAADNPPDLCWHKLYEHSMFTYALKGMVDEVEDYIDLNNKILWGDLKSYYNQSKYNGHNYVMIYNVTTGPWVFYNKKMFRDAGVADLWETYKANPTAWTWTKLEEVGKKLADKDNGIVGLATDDGVGFFHTTGQTFGEIGLTRETTKSNMKNQAFARAAEFLTNGRTAGWVDTAIHGSDEKFAAESAAMVFTLSVAPEGCEDLFRRGDVGIVPMPRDPESKTLWNYKNIEGFYIPTKAKNPNAGVAYAICQRYLYQTNEGQEELKQELRDKGFTELNITQFNEPDRVGKPIIDMAQNLGYTNVWNCLMHQHTWASTFKGETQDATNVMLDEIFVGVE